MSAVGLAVLLGSWSPTRALAASHSATGSWAWGESLKSSGIPLTSAQLSYLQTQQQIAGGAVPAQDLSQKQVSKFKEILSRPLANVIVTPYSLNGSAARVQAASNSDSTNLNGSLPNSSATHYLEWQRSLNPTKFDQTHPALGAALAQSSANQSLPSTSHDTASMTVSALATPTSTNAASSPTPHYGMPITYAHYVVPPPGVNLAAPAAVPEPSGWALMAIGAGLLARSLRKKTALAER